LQILDSKVIRKVNPVRNPIGALNPAGIIEAPRPQAGASRKGNIVLIVPLDPAYKAELAEHLPVKMQSSHRRDC